MTLSSAFRTGALARNFRSRKKNCEKISLKTQKKNKIRTEKLFQERSSTVRILIRHSFILKNIIILLRKRTEILLDYS